MISKPTKATKVFEVIPSLSQCIVASSDLVNAPPGKAACAFGVKRKPSKAVITMTKSPETTSKSIPIKNENAYGRK